MKNRLLLLLIPLFCVIRVNASHIIGGEIYYACTGGSNYTITLVVYRDCTSLTGFDNPAYVGVYNSSGTLVQNLAMYSPVINSVPVESADPCLEVPPGICVEQAIYTANITLPAEDVYTIVYQRCCRNAGIVNINAPDATGSTYWQVIPDTGSTTGNSCPYFNNYPPSVICTTESIVFDHSATDPDGDSLVYHFITPYDGADAIAPMPIPPPPPPYGNVLWLAGYSVDYQIDASPAFAIDPETGLLTGSATSEGRYVVGIAVDEYRDGVLLGTHFRDFQFNVVTCTPLVTAATTDYTLDCEDLTVSFSNFSTGADTYLWDFGDGTTSTEFAPTHTFPDTGTYYVTLIANPGFVCADTFIATVALYNTLTANFDYVAGCSGTPVGFTDQSVTTEAGDIISWDWNFGDGDSSSDMDPSHEYGDGGSYPVTLTVETDKGCVSTITENVNVDAGPSVNFSTDDVCQNEAADFTNLSTITTGTITEYDWDFGDGSTTMVESPTHMFDAPGDYTVTLIAFSANGCSDTATENIHIGELPDAYAGPDDTVPYLGSYVMQGSGIGSFTWYPLALPWPGFISDPHIANPEVALENTTTFFLTVVSPDGCTETDTVTIYVTDRTIVDMPDAFTPNGDGINDVLYVLNHSVSELYEYSIYNRWGQRIFTTNNVNVGWDGTANGVEQEIGSYVYVVRGRGLEGKDFELKGNVTLIR